MKRVSAGTLLFPALAALALALIAQWWAGRAGGARGNALVFVNATESSIDSVVVVAEPPYSNPLAGRTGYVAARDSVRLPLANAKGDVSVRVFRKGRVLAEHVVYFGGDSEFELWVTETGSPGRYRRSGAGSGAGSGSGTDSSADSRGAKPSGT